MPMRILRLLYHPRIPIVICDIKSEPYPLKKGSMSKRIRPGHPIPDVV